MRLISSSPLDLAPPHISLPHFLFSPLPPGSSLPRSLVGASTGPGGGGGGGSSLPRSLVGASTGGPALMGGAWRRLPPPPLSLLIALGVALYSHVKSRRAATSRPATASTPENSPLRPTPSVVVVVVVVVPVEVDSVVTSGVALVSVESDAIASAVVSIHSIATYV